MDACRLYDQKNEIKMKQVMRIGKSKRNAQFPVCWKSEFIFHFDSENTSIPRNFNLVERIYYNTWTAFVTHGQQENISYSYLSHKKKKTTIFSFFLFSYVRSKSGKIIFIFLFFGRQKLSSCFVETNNRHDFQFSHWQQAKWSWIRFVEQQIRQR